MALTFGQKAADIFATSLGSWAFILIQSAILVIYVIMNISGLSHFDPYPFILLNLLLSFQAAFATPILMMANNRQAEIDRANAKLDLDTNVKGEQEIEVLLTQIESLHAKIDAIVPKTD